MNARWFGDRRWSGNESTKIFRAFMSRLSCVHVQTMVTKPSCVHVQTIVRSCPDRRAFIRVSRQCNFERTTAPSCVHFGLDISGFGLGSLMVSQPGFSAWAPSWLHITQPLSSFFFNVSKKCILDYYERYCLRSCHHNENGYVSGQFKSRNEFIKLLAQLELKQF